MWPATRTVSAMASGRTSMAGASQSSSTSARWSKRRRSTNPELGVNSGSGDSFLREWFVLEVRGGNEPMQLAVVLAVRPHHGERAVQPESQGLPILDCRYNAC